MGFKTVTTLLLAWLAVLSPRLWATQDPGGAVSFGIFPYVTPVQLAKFHNPLRDYLEETIGRPVVLVTAPTFPEFVARTQQGLYDYVLTAPHLARLAQVRDGYEPLVKTGHQVQGVYLVPKESPIRSLQDIRGHSIMMVGQAAIISQMVVRQLAELGLRDGENIEIRTTRTHNNAMYAALRGESDVSVTGILLYDKINLHDRDKVRVVGHTPGVPGFILLAGNDVAGAERTRVKAALIGFADTPAGKAYVEPTGFKRLLPIDEAEMESLQPFIARFLDKR